MSNDLILLYLSIGFFGLGVAFVVVGIVSLYSRVTILRRVMRQSERLLRGIPPLRIIEGEENVPNKKGKK